MTKNQIKTLEDLKAFIEFAIETGFTTYTAVLATIGHDINGLFDTKDKLFLPRTHGYSKRIKELKK